MNDAITILHDLTTKPHCLLPHYADALKTKLRLYIENDDFELPDSDKPHSKHLYEVIDDIAVVTVNGIICKRVGLSADLLEYFNLVDLDNLDAAVKQLTQDDAIKSVVFYITSPGGFVSGLTTTWQYIDALSKKKETVVFSDVINASAAYYISSAARMIVASYDAEVGSIGTFTELVSISRQLADNGIDARIIQGGSLKAIGHPYKPLDQETIDYVQSEVNAIWLQFKDVVNTKRTIDDTDMQGQTFAGKPLVDKGFVDGLARDIEEVITMLK